MFNTYKKINELNRIIDKKDNTINELFNEVSRKNAEIKTLTDKVNNFETESYDADIAVDWKKINVFSVERMIGENGKAKTIISFMIRGENSVMIPKEWVFYCSMEKHQQLVDEFRQSMKEKVVIN